MGRRHAGGPIDLTKPFVAVTAAAVAFFLYVGMLVPIIPTFVDDELGAGEIGVGLSLAAFAGDGDLSSVRSSPASSTASAGARDDRRLADRRGGRDVAARSSTRCGRCSLLRGVAGIGEAALFVGAATLIADLAPPDRRAEAASYFSRRRVRRARRRPDHRRGRARRRSLRPRVRRRRRLRLAVGAARPRRPSPRGDDRRPTEAGPAPPAAPRHRPHHAPRRASDPASCWRRHRRVRPCSRRSCPTTPGTIGLGRLWRAVRRLQRRLPRAALRRRPLARAPRRPRAVPIAFVALAAALGSLAAVPGGVGALGGGGPDRRGMAFLYPSLMALTVNRASERERPLAISSFTMFFEVGNIGGGARVRHRSPSWRASGRRSASAVVLCAFGAWILLAHVVPSPRSPSPAPRRPPSPSTPSSSGCARAANIRTKMTLTTSWCRRRMSRATQTSSTADDQRRELLDDRQLDELDADFHDLDVDRHRRRSTTPRSSGTWATRATATPTRAITNSHMIAGMAAVRLLA